MATASSEGPTTTT